MRTRGRILLAGTAGLLLLVLLWSVFPGLARQATRSQPEPQRQPDLPAEEPPPYELVVPTPTRDLFAFGPAGTPPPSRPGASSGRALAGMDAASPPKAAPQPRARLVGFMQSEGRIAAALVVDSAVELVQAGGEIHGYRILSIDADAGTVRLRTPDGQELELSAPAE